MIESIGASFTLWQRSPASGRPLALMALIFFLSRAAGPELGSRRLGPRAAQARAHDGVRAAVRALAPRAAGASPWAAAAIAVGYAITDELHQTKVDGRHGAPVDVLIDAVGVAAGWLATHRITR